MSWGHDLAGGGVCNPPSRGAVCEQRTYGSVRGGAGNRPAYSTSERGPKGRFVSSNQSLGVGPRGLAPALQRYSNCFEWARRERSTQRSTAGDGAIRKGDSAVLRSET
jgi:hypothetical protein